MSWQPWMNADPADAWYSEAHLARQRAAEHEKRECRVMLERRKEFELIVGCSWRALGREELRLAWKRADAIARGRR